MDNKPTDRRWWKVTVDCRIWPRSFNDLNGPLSAHYMRRPPNYAKLSRSIRANAVSIRF